MSAIMAVAPSRLDVDPAVWTPAHGALIRAAAEDPRVQRGFVNPAIKKALCREAGGEGECLTKVRPYWGHDYHFHVRLACPSGNPDCKPQDPVPAEEGCGKDLDWGLRDLANHPQPVRPPDPPNPRKTT